jgi:hypothetical protein
MAFFRRRLLVEETSVDGGDSNHERIRSRRRTRKGEGREEVREFCKWRAWRLFNY